MDTYKKMIVNCDYSQFFFYVLSVGSCGTRQTCRTVESALKLSSASPIATTVNILSSYSLVYYELYYNNITTQV